MSRTTLTLTAPIFFPELPGTFRQYFNYAPGLRDRGVDLTVFTLGEEDGLTEWLNGIKVIHRNLRHPHHYMERQRLVEPALTEALKNLDGAAQVVAPLGNNWEMMRQIRRYKKRGIGASTYIPTAPEYAGKGLAVWKQRLATHLQLRHFDSVILCSSAQVAIYREQFWLSGKTTTHIPNGVNLDRFRPADGPERLELRAKLGLSPEEVIFCFVGNMVERKGVDFLVRAWKEVQTKHAKARLLLIGQRTMPVTFRDAELQNAHRIFEKRLDAALAGLSPQGLPVLFQSHTDRVEDWLRASDAFLFPSYCEGLPNALLEAMACGLPSVTAPFAGLPLDGEELGHRGREHWVVPHEEGAWAGAVCRLVEDLGMRDSMGRAGALWMRQHHDYAKVLDLWAEHYHGIGKRGYARRK